MLASLPRDRVPRETSPTMTGRMIRVLVIDDSALIREMICDAIGDTPDMEVVGRAPNGARGLELLDRLDPDVVTLDIQMPGMDGLETLDAILQKRPVPVIMVSSLTQIGATVTLDALDRGAIDYVAKPERGSETQTVFHSELPRKIRSAKGTDVRRILQIRRRRSQRTEERRKRSDTPRPPERVDAVPEELADKCIALGISTGGPPALSALFENLRPPMPPIVIVQHMPPQFTKPLAWRLNAASRLTVSEAKSGDLLRPNHALIAPGGRHLELRPQGRSAKVLLRDGPPVSSHKPSVDVMMKSAARIFGRRCLGVIMTGMGRDGSDGCAAIRAAGGFVLGQDEASSDVYGMNKVAMNEGNVDRQFSLGEATGTLALQIKRLWAPTGVA